MMIIFPTTVAIASTADSFQGPLDAGYKVTGYRFGEYEPADQYGTRYYHLEEDLKASYPQAVHVVADGVVVYSSTKSSGYGSAVVVQHTLPDGSNICSIYGHLSKQKGIVAKGSVVTKNQIIGYIGKTAENGGWGEHLHFGIRKGVYQNNLDGRSLSSSAISKFYKPSDYLNLIRAVGSPVTCRLSNMENKIWVPSVDAMTSCGWRMDDIRPVTQTEMDRHTTVSASLNFPPGTFIKQAGSSEISIIKEYADGGGRKNRFRQAFSSWSAFLKAGGKSDLSNVRIVSYDEYNLYTQGKYL